ncbi:MAG: methyl-accepting chemotaxis protein [Phycisphaerae bacterium]|nr:methyl-accepting chemotaxis protein [Phycisphaerae bacterium]
MTETTRTRTWWHRLTDGLRRTRPGRNDHGLPAVGEDGLLADSEAAERPPGALTRWSKRDQALTQLQEGYEQVARLVGDIQKHLSDQTVKTDRICSALEQLARSTSDLPDIARQQVRMLESIAGQLETTNAGTHKLTAAVEEVPRIARAQTDTLTGINRQLGMVSEQNVVTSQAMEKLSTAIHSVGEVNGAQAQILRQMYAKAEEQTEQVNRLIDRQGRRFVMLFVVTLVLAIAAIGSLAVALAMRS